MSILKKLPRINSGNGKVRKRLRACGEDGQKVSPFGAEVAIVAYMLLLGILNEAQYEDFISGKEIIVYVPDCVAKTNVVAYHEPHSSRKDFGHAGEIPKEAFMDQDTFFVPGKMEMRGDKMRILGLLEDHSWEDYSIWLERVWRDVCGVDIENRQNLYVALCKLHNEARSKSWSQQAKATASPATANNVTSSTVNADGDVNIGNGAFVCSPIRLYQVCSEIRTSSGINDNIEDILQSITSSVCRAFRSILNVMKITASDATSIDVAECVLRRIEGIPEDRIQAAIKALRSTQPDNKGGEHHEPSSSQVQTEPRDNDTAEDVASEFIEVPSPTEGRRVLFKTVESLIGLLEKAPKYAPGVDADKIKKAIAAQRKAMEDAKKEGRDYIGAPYLNWLLSEYDVYATTYTNDQGKKITCRYRLDG